MRILSLSNCPLVESQGSGYVVLNFCRGLRERGHTVDAFGPEAYECFSFLTRGKRYRQALGLWLFVTRQLRKKPYDLVEFYGGESWLAASALSRKSKRSYILVSHSNGLETHQIELTRKYLNSAAPDGSNARWFQLSQAGWMQKAFTRVDGLVTVSAYDREYALRQKYQEASHVVAIENALHEDYLGLAVGGPRKPVIGFCGPWIPRKGARIIQTDLTKILAEFPECSLKLIGVGHLFKKEAYFPGALCPRIEVIPFVQDKKRLREIFQSLAIAIAPSIYESFGLAGAEAMACGCALISPSTGWAATLKDREEAMIMPEPASPWLYEALRELLLDESLRARISKVGHARVQGLRWDKAIDQIGQTYQRWLDER